MNTSLYSTTIVHERFNHFKNKFKYSVLSMYIDHDELQFLDSSTLNHALCLEIAEGTFGNKAISYEDLCHKIPRKIGSRSTILNSLNNAVSKKYFIKESVDYDKRIKIYKLSSNFQTVMIEWINELKKVTNEIE